MSAVDDLLQSPLDDGDHSSWPTWLMWLALVGVFMLGVVGGWAAIRGGGAHPASTSASTAAEAPGTDPVDIDSGLDASVVAGFGDEAGTWFVVSLSTDPDSAQGEAAAFLGGVWELEGSGSTTPYTGEYFNPLYAGVLTVHFPTSEVPAGGQLRVHPYEKKTSVAKTRLASFSSLPWSGQPVAPSIEINAETDLMVENISIDQEGVSLRWRLDGDPAAVASLTMSGELEEDGRQVALLRHDTLADDQGYGFLTSPRPPGYVIEPIRQTAPLRTGELHVPFHTGTDLAIDGDYTLRVTLAGSIARVGDNDVAIPIDTGLTFPRTTGTTPPGVLDGEESPTSTSPPAGMSGAMVTTGIDNQLMLFGGLSSGRIHGSTWIHDVAAKTWIEIGTDSGPSARADHSMVYVPSIDRVLLYGGTAGFGGCPEDPLCNDKPLGDTWLWNPATHEWEQMAVDGAPSPRRGARAVYDSTNDRVMLFGGETRTADQEREFLNETWIFDLSTMEWSEMETGTVPDARARAGMFFDPVNDQVVVFGGEGPAQKRDNQLWILDTATTTWTAIDAGPEPGPRWGFVFEYDPTANAAILIGGAGTRKTEGVGGTRTSLAYFDDIWRFDPQSLTWAELTPIGDGGASIWRSAAVDPASGVLVTFGGAAADASKEGPSGYGNSRTYHLDLATQKWR